MTLRRSASKIPWGVIGMLPILFAVEAWVESRTLDVTSPATMSWRLSESASRHEAVDADVLFLGDSLVKHGLLPEISAEESGLKGFNLSVCAAQAAADFYLLRNALHSGAKPTKLVVAYTPDLLMGSPRELLRCYPELLTPAEVIELARIERDTSFGVETLLNMAFRSIKARHEIRDVLWKTYLGTADASPRPVSQMLARNWSIHQGAQFTPENPSYHGEVTPDDLKRLNASRFWCHRTNRVYVEKLLRLAESRRIQVYWLLSPMAPKVQAERDRSGAERRFEAFVESFREAHPTLQVIDARRSGYGPELFVDPVHLNGRGAIALTRQIAAILKRSESGGWTVVEAPKVPAVLPDLEDLHGSRLAIETQNGATIR